METRTYSYRYVDAWQESQNLAQEVLLLVKQMKRDVVSIEVMKQLVRAAGSVPANVAEGHGRFTPAAYRNHLLIARGSLCEVGSWLDLLKRLNYLSAEAEGRLSRSADALIRLITAKAKTLEKKAQETAEYGKMPRNTSQTRR